jgi:hypothetical protein
MMDTEHCAILQYLVAGFYVETLQMEMNQELVHLQCGMLYRGFVFHY